MNVKKRIAAAATAAVMLTSLAVATPAHAEDKKDIRRYQVAFTLGQGLRLRTGPSTSAPGYGDGNYILPEGAWFSGECEAIGERITNPYGESTDVWMRTPGGYYVSEAFLQTGTNSSVGLPLCAELDAEAKQSVTRRTAADLSVGERLQAGASSVTVTNSAKTSGRTYFSKTETRKLADRLDKAGSAANTGEFIGNVVCAVAGVGLGIVLPQGRVLLAAAAGFGFDIGCGLAASAGSKESDETVKARGAARAAADGDRCYEARGHRSDSGKWVYDVFPTTDNPGYCG